MNYWGLGGANDGMQLFSSNIALVDASIKMGINPKSCREAFAGISLEKTTFKLIDPSFEAVDPSVAMCDLLPWGAYTAFSDRAVEFWIGNGVAATDFLMFADTTRHEQFGLYLPSNWLDGIDIEHSIFERTLPVNPPLMSKPISLVFNDHWGQESALLTVKTPFYEQIFAEPICTEKCRLEWMQREFTGATFRPISVRFPSEKAKKK